MKRAYSNSSLLWDDENEDHPDSKKSMKKSSQDSRNSKSERRKWSKDEDDLLILFISKNGTNNWKGAAELYNNGRTAKQCRERWINHLDPSIVKGKLSQEEWEIVLNAQEERGNRWSEIAKLLPGRTPNQIKNVWHAMSRRETMKKSKSRRRLSGDEDDSIGVEGHDEEGERVSEGIGGDERGPEVKEILIQQHRGPLQPPNHHETPSQIPPPPLHSPPCQRPQDYPESTCQVQYRQHQLHPSYHPLPVYQGHSINQFKPQDYYIPKPPPCDDEHRQESNTYPHSESSSDHLNTSSEIDSEEDTIYLLVDKSEKQKKDSLSPPHQKYHTSFNSEKSIQHQISFITEQASPSLMLQQQEDDHISSSPHQLKSNMTKLDILVQIVLNLLEDDRM